MRRRVTVPALTASVAAALVLAACGNGDTAEEPESPADDAAVDTDDDLTEDDAADDADDGTAEDDAAADAVDGAVTIWVDETRQDAVEQAAAQFTEDTGVEVVTQLRNFDEIRNDFISQVPTGEGPDIAVGAHDWIGEFVVNGVVAPIELGAVADDFEPVSLEAVTYDDQVYALPYAVENLALIVNTELTDVIPETWDEAIEASEEAGAEYPILLQMDTEGDPYIMYPMQTSFGAEVFEQNEDGTYEPVVAMGGEPGEQFAEWLAEQGEAGVLDTAITWDIAREAFANGESPYMISGPWMLPYAEGLDIEVHAIPRPGPEMARPFVGVQGFFINAQSENALLANDLVVNYLSGEEAQVALFEAGGRTPAVQAAAEVANENPVIAGFSEVGAEGFPMPSIPEMGVVFDHWGVAHAQIVDGTDDPAGLWQSAIDTIQSELD